jgi:hypothetical protein
MQALGLEQLGTDPSWQRRIVAQRLTPDVTQPVGVSEKKHEELEKIEK